MAITPDGLKLRRLVVNCKKLLSERGEAAGVSLAKVTRDLYRELDKKGQARFFAALLAEFSPDPARVLAASKAYAAEPSAAHLAQLSLAAEPPRQELLRRLNRAPGGTATILRMPTLTVGTARSRIATCTFTPRWSTHTRTIPTCTTVTRISLGSPERVRPPRGAFRRGTAPNLPCYRRIQNV